jgi:hypothetical protein
MFFANDEKLADNLVLRRIQKIHTSSEMYDTDVMA